MSSAKRMKLDDNKSSPSKGKRPTKPEIAVPSVTIVEYVEGFQFLQLDDASIRLILDNLTLNDIFAVALTCKRLYDLSSKWFFDAYPYQADDVYDIEARSGILKFPGCEEYVALFSRINKISVGASMSQSMEDLMRNFQNKSLSEIRFVNWRPMRTSHLKKVLNMFKQTKTVIFSDMKFADEPYKCILQHMPAMERLELWTNLNIATKDDDKHEWLQQTYPNLKHFAWHMKAELNVTEMEQFFAANAQIEQFSLLSSSMETVNRCTVAGINITKLYLKIDDDLILTLIELNTFCGNDMTKRLHLLITDECRDELSKHLKMLSVLSKNIDGLYFNKTPVDKPLIAVINQIGHLKCLQLRASKLADTLTDLHRLEEVWLPEKKFILSGDDVLQTLESFAIHSPALKKIHFRNNAELFMAFDFAALDAARQQLHEVPKIAIYVDASIINGSRFAEMEKDFSTFYIKGIEIEDIDNPLMNEFMKLKGANGKRLFAGSCDPVSARTRISNQ